MNNNRQRRDGGAMHAARFLAGLFAGTLAGAATMLMVAPQSGEQTRREIKSKGLELRDEATEGLTEAGHRIQEQAAALQERGKGVGEAISVSKDNIAQAVNESKDRVVAAVFDSKERGRSRR